MASPNPSKRPLDEEENVAESPKRSKQLQENLSDSSSSGSSSSEEESSSESETSGKSFLNLFLSTQITFYHTDK